MSDLVDGIWRLLNSDVNDPMNIGNPAEMTILEFAEAIIELTGSSSELGFEPLPTDDPKIRQPDITFAQAELDWEPTVPLKKGLERTIAYFRDRVVAEEVG